MLGYHKVIISNTLMQLSLPLADVSSFYAYPRWVLAAILFFSLTINFPVLTSSGFFYYYTTNVFAAIIVVFVLDF